MTYRQIISVIVLNLICTAIFAQIPKTATPHILSLDSLKKISPFHIPSASGSMLPGALTSQYAKIANLINFKKQFSPVRDIYKNPVILNAAEAEYNMATDGSYYLPGTRSYFGDVLVNSSWTVASIPFDIKLDNQAWNDLANNNFSFFSIHFDKDAYLKQIKNKLKGKFNPDDFLNPDISKQVEAFKKNAESILKKDIDNINKTYGNVLNDKIKQLGDLKGLLNKDLASLRQQLLKSDFIKSVEEKERMLTELQNRKNTGQAVDRAEIKNLEKEVGKMKGAQALLAKVEEHKGKWESSGLLAKIKKLDLLNKKQAADILKDPSSIAKLGKQYLNLNGLQKLFLNVSKLNIGQNTLSQSPLSVQHLLNKGVNTEFLNNNRYLALGMSKLKSLNSIFDQQYTDNLNALDGSAKMVRIGIGGLSASHSHISLMSYNQTFGSFDGLNSFNNFRNTIVTTISNEITIGQRGSITTEVSRSATSYQNPEQSGTGLPNKSSLQRIISSDNLFKNIALSVKYEDELEDKGLSYGVHVNTTAPGYTNPGSSFLNAGGKELGLNVKKSFLKRKLQASVRTDMREYKYGDEGSAVWRNFYTVMDIRWRMNKGQTIGIRYMPNKMVRVDKGLKSTVTSVERLSADANIAKKIAGLYYRNNISLTWQKNSYNLDNQQVLNKSLTLASFQNIILNRKLLYLNLNYDYADNHSQFVYFNSSLIAEAGVTYELFKKVSLSSALSYNSVQSWYRQIGIKQTITNQLSDRFNLDIYIDARKNIALYQPLLYGLFRADISIRYLIKQ